MALYGRLFSLIRLSQFHVQTFESRLGRITEIPLYTILAPLRQHVRTNPQPSFSGSLLPPRKTGVGLFTPVYSIYRSRTLQLFVGVAGPAARQEQVLVGARRRGRGQRRRVDGQGELRVLRVRRGHRQVPPRRLLGRGRLQHARLSRHRRATQRCKVQSQPHSCSDAPSAGVLIFTTSGRYKERLVTGSGLNTRIFTLRQGFYKRISRNKMFVLKTNIVKSLFRYP